MAVDRKKGEGEGARESKIHKYIYTHKNSSAHRSHKQSIDTYLCTYKYACIQTCVNMYT